MTCSVRNHRLLGRLLVAMSLVAGFGFSGLVQAQSILRYPALTGQGHSQSADWTPPSTPVVAQPVADIAPETGDPGLASLRARFEQTQVAPQVPSIGRSVLVRSLAPESPATSEREAVRLAARTESESRLTGQAPRNPAGQTWNLRVPDRQPEFKPLNQVSTTGAPSDRSASSPGWHRPAPAWQHPRYEERIISSNQGGWGWESTPAAPASWAAPVSRSGSTAVAGGFHYPQPGAEPSPPRAGQPTPAAATFGIRETSPQRPVFGGAFSSAASVGSSSGFGYASSDGPAPPVAAPQWLKQVLAPPPAGQEGRGFGYASATPNSAAPVSPQRTASFFTDPSSGQPSLGYPAGSGRR